MVVKRKSKKSAHGHKHVTLRHHHAKPYRKRHYGVLLVCLFGFVVALALLIQYRDQVITGIQSSRDFVADMVRGGGGSYETNLQSSHGFSVRFDHRLLYATATDGTRTYRPGELGITRSYTSLELAPFNTDSLAKQTSLTMKFHPETVASQTPQALRSLALVDAGVREAGVAMMSQEAVTLGGKQFEKSVWRTNVDGSLRASFSVYTGVLNGHVLTIVISEGFTNEPGQDPLYADVLNSLKFGRPLASVGATASTAVASVSKPSVFDTFMMTKLAAAASSQTETTASQRIAALYDPAVVKIYNVFCVDLTVDGKSYAKNMCSGVTGSGFFVSQDGYIATNGHVVSLDARDLAIQYAIAYLAYTGETSYLYGLMDIAGISESDISGLDSEKALGLVIDRLYNIEETHFALANDVQNLLVTVGSEGPDIDKLTSATKDRKKYETNSSVIAATPVAADFRTLDNSNGTGFKASDVAIIKVQGTNFPIAHLGSIDEVSQGDNLLILGFPGESNDNKIVDSKETVATLTTGKVSAKKKASGSERTLIETDTTIGHGNSGGPAFVDSGDVIGIATYTADGSGEGGGVYNYIRDIKDLKDLAKSKLIAFDSDSQTQSEWEKGMELFYTSHYSAALVNFNKVKDLYPNHNKVAEFIATANKRIAAGEDVKDFPVVPVATAAGVALLGVIVSVVVIVRHKKKHAIYKAGVAQGSVNPMARGSSPQQVAVAPATVQPVQQTGPASPVAQAPAPAPQPPVAPSGSSGPTQVQ